GAVLLARLTPRQGLETRRRRDPPDRQRFDRRAQELEQRRHLADRILMEASVADLVHQSGVRLGEGVDGAYRLDPQIYGALDGLEMLLRAGGEGVFVASAMAMTHPRHRHVARVADAVDDLGLREQAMQLRQVMGVAG